METREKRRLIIWTFIGIGFFLPILSVSLANISIDITLVMFCISSYLSSMTATLISHILKGGVAVGVLIFIAVQSIIYGGIGWIIARPIYPNRKISDKAETPQD